MVNRRSVITGSGLLIISGLAGCSSGPSAGDLEFTPNTSVPTTPPPVKIDGQTSGQDTVLDISMNAKQMSSIITSDNEFNSESSRYQGDDDGEANVLCLKLHIENNTGSEVTVDLSRFVSTVREDDIVTCEECSPAAILNISSEKLTADSGGEFEALLVYEISNSVTEVEISFLAQDSDEDKLATPEGDTIGINPSLDRELNINRMELFDSVSEKVEIESEVDAEDEEVTVRLNIKNIADWEVSSYEHRVAFFADDDRLLGDNSFSVTGLKANSSEEAVGEYEFDRNKLEDIKERAGPINYKIPDEQ